MLTIVTGDRRCMSVSLSVSLSVSELVCQAAQPCVVHSCSLCQIISASCYRCLCLLFSARKLSLGQTEQEKEKPLTSIFQLASIVDTLRHQDDVVPDFQRVTITGEETSGVSRESNSFELHQSCTRVQILGPDPTQPTEIVTELDPTC